MNTTATYLPYTTAKADSLLIAPFAALYNQRAKLRVWAFSAAVRLSDQDKPIAMKLLVELAIVVRTLALLAQNARCASGKTVVAHRAKRPVARVAARRVKPAKRSAPVAVRPHGQVAAPRKLPAKSTHRSGPADASSAGAEAARTAEAKMMSPEGRFLRRNITTPAARQYS